VVKIHEAEMLLEQGAVVSAPGMIYWIWVLLRETLNRLLVPVLVDGGSV
jgi:hypothetical protein